MTSVDSGSVSWREKNGNKYVKNCHMWITPTVQAAAAILHGVHKQWVLSLGCSWLCDSENRNHISSVPGGRRSDDVMRWLEMRLSQWPFCCPHWMPPCKCLIAEGFIWVCRGHTLNWEGERVREGGRRSHTIDWYTHWMVHTGQFFFSYSSTCCVNNGIWAPATELTKLILLREQMLATLKLVPGFWYWSGLEDKRNTRRTLL